MTNNEVFSMGENVKEKVDLYGALFVACLYVTNLWVQT